MVDASEIEAACRAKKSSSSGGTSKRCLCAAAAPSNLDLCSDPLRPGRHGAFAESLPSFQQVRISQVSHYQDKILSKAFLAECKFAFSRQTHSDRMGIPSH